MTAGAEEDAGTTAFVDLGGRYIRARARSSEFCRSRGLGAVGAVLASPILSRTASRRRGGAATWPAQNQLHFWSFGA
eukprot:scaffold126921_cov48-Phaeocystis_antarctica.AAC.3